MKRPNQIHTRDKHGRLMVVLEIEKSPPGNAAGGPSLHYELANRSRVTRLSDREFVVEDGRRLVRI